MVDFYRLGNAVVISNAFKWVRNWIRICLNWSFNLADKLSDIVRFKALSYRDIGYKRMQGKLPYYLIANSCSQSEI